MGRWHEENNKSFVNPYNFVPLTDCEPKREPLHYDTDSFTGVIHCRLTVKTPLAMPDHEGIPDSTEHHKYPFYSIDHQPVIPGSELRGMVRSVHETITNSCLSVLDTKPLTGRVKDSKKPGLLKRNGDTIELYTAKTYVLNTITQWGTSYHIDPRITCSGNHNEAIDKYILTADGKKREPEITFGSKLPGFILKANSILSVI